MNNLTEKLIVTLVVVPILLGIFKDWKVMTAAIGAIMVALFFANIDKFSKFKGGGIEAELKTAVDDAYAAIEELKELGLSLTSPITDELAMSGSVLSYIPLEYKLQRVEKIAKTLKKLGASDEEVNEACFMIYLRVESEHVSRVIGKLKKANPGKEKLLDFKMGDLNNWDLKKLKVFLLDNELEFDEDSEEALENLEYFHEHRKLRHPDQWQG